MFVALTEIENLVKKYETEIQTTIANHTALTAVISVLKSLANIATPIVDALVPGASEAVTIVNAVDTAINEVAPSEPETTTVASS